jgi:hypothetical protein
MSGRRRESGNGTSEDGRSGLPWSAAQDSTGDWSTPAGRRSSESRHRRRLLAMSPRPKLLRSQPLFSANSRRPGDESSCAVAQRISNMTNTEAGTEKAAAVAFRAKDAPKRPSKKGATAKNAARANGPPRVPNPRPQPRSRPRLPRRPRNPPGPRKPASRAPRARPR